MSRNALLYLEQSNAQPGDLFVRTIGRGNRGLRIPYLYPVAFILASTWYGIASRQLADSGVQALTWSSVPSCMLAVLPRFFYTWQSRAPASLIVATGKELSEFSVRDAAYIVSEGLVCAAVAPVIAAVMRLGGLERTAASTSSPAEFRNILEEFARRSIGMAQNMERLSSAIAASAERYENSAVSQPRLILATDVRVWQIALACLFVITSHGLGCQWRAPRQKSTVGAEGQRLSQ